MRLRTFIDPRMWRIRVPAVAALCISATALLPVYVLARGGDDTLLGACTALLFGISCIAFLGAMLFKPEAIVLPRSALLLAPLPLLGVAFISALGTLAPRLALFGAGFEFGTFGSLVLLVIAVFLGALMSSRGALMFVRAILLLGLMTLGMIVWKLFTHAPFASPEWQQAPLFLAVSAIVAAISFDRSRGRERIFYALAAAIFVAGSFLCGVPEIALIAIAAIVVVLGGRYAFNAATARLSFPVAGALVCVAFAISAIAMPHVPAIGIDQIDRPSFSEMFATAGSEYVHSLPRSLVGTGPASFAYAWNLYRPVELNETSWWNTTPLVPYSAAGSIALMFGLLGLAALCVLPAALFSVLTHARTGDIEEEALLESSGAIAAFSFLAACIYPVGTAVILVGCAGLGISVRTLSADDLIRFEPEGRMRLAVPLLAALFGGIFLYVGVHQVSAFSQYALGESLVSKNPAAAVLPLQKSAQEWPLAQYQLAAAQATANAAIALAQTQKQNGILDTAALEFSAKSAAQLSNLATESDPRDADMWISRAALFALLQSVGFDGFSNDIQDSLSRASALAPTRPDILLDEGIVAKLSGNMLSARQYAQEALEIRPEYEDARTFLLTLPRQP